MGLRDKFRTKKSKDGPEAGGAAAAQGGSAAQAHPPPRAAPAGAPRGAGSALPVDPASSAAGQPFAQPRQARQVRSADERKQLENETELVDQIMELKKKKAGDEGKLQTLQAKKKAVLGQLKAVRSRKTIDPRANDRLGRQVKMLNQDIDDVELGIRNADDVMHMLEKRLEQREAFEQTKKVNEVAQKVKVDEEKLEDTLYEAKENVEETQRVRDIMQGIRPGEETYVAPGELDDELERELAMYEEDQAEEEEALANKVSSLATDDAVERIKGAEETPTVVPGRVTASDAGKEEDMMADLEKEMAV